MASSHLAMDLIKEDFVVSFPELPNKNSPNLEMEKSFKSRIRAF